MHIERGTAQTPRASPSPPYIKYAYMCNMHARPAGQLASMTRVGLFLFAKTYNGIFVEYLCKSKNSNDLKFGAEKNCCSILLDLYATERMLSSLNRCAHPCRSRNTQEAQFYIILNSDKLQNIYLNHNCLANFVLVSYQIEGFFPSLIFS